MDQPPAAAIRPVRPTLDCLATPAAGLSATRPGTRAEGLHGTQVMGDNCRSRRRFRRRSRRRRAAQQAQAQGGSLGQPAG